MKSGSRLLKSPISEPQDTLQEIRTTVMLAFAKDSCRCTWAGETRKKKWHQALRTDEGNHNAMTSTGSGGTLHVLVRLLLDADKVSFTH
jgi:hypothetical protein